MPISREVQLAVDEIHRERNLLASLDKANQLQAEQIRDLGAQISALKVGAQLSEEDKKALLDAVNEAGETNTALADAVPANADIPAATPGYVPPTPPPNDPEAPRPDPIAGTGQAGTVPLMPNLAFNPSPGTPPPVVEGQPNQPAAIETAGGFVVAGGGSTQRAPGSRPESPSSSHIVPTDPDAKGPASTADEVKSGLGDSSQNATIGNDLKPVGEGPGIPKEPTEAQVQAEQNRQNALADEKARREANPLALSPEDLAKRDEAARIGKSEPAPAA